MRVFFITDKNEIVGTKTGRTPRKAKKRLKAIGEYKPPTPFQGFDISLLDTENKTFSLR